MTVGSPIKCLLMFSVPLLIGNLAQLLYSTVDSIVVGKYCGDAALSALGVTTPIVTLFMVVFMAIGSGVMVMVSQYFGAKEYRLLESTIGNAFTLIAIASVFLTAVGIPLTPAILNAINTPAEVYDMAKAYLIIILIGSAGDGFYNIFSGILRGLGESVYPLIVLILTTVLNIALDIWFVAGLGMGVAGAAWATTICKTVSAIACVIKVLLIKDNFKIHLKDLKLIKSIVLNVCRLGIPNGLAQGIMFFSTIIVQAFVNKMGYIVTASITAVLRVDAFAVIPSQTFGMCSSTFTGQNVGAGKLDRVKQGSRDVFLMSLGTSIVMVALILIFGKWMMGLFTSTPEVIDLAYEFILIMLPAYILLTLVQTYGGVIRGAGDSMPPMWFNIITNTVIRIPLMIILVKATTSEIYPAGNPRVNWISFVIAMCINTIATMVYYFSGRWKNKSIINRETQSN